RFYRWPSAPVLQRCLLYGPAPHGGLHSFTTRRSSDLGGPLVEVADRRGRVEEPATGRGEHRAVVAVRDLQQLRARPVAGSSTRPDRKSTRLNSSHRTISYAVFCLKKKKTTKQATPTTR